MKSGYQLLVGLLVASFVGAVHGADKTIETGPPKTYVIGISPLFACVS
jgi:hypothetical protein